MLIDNTAAQKTRAQNIEVAVRNRIEINRRAFAITTGQTTRHKYFLGYSAAAHAKGNSHGDRSPHNARQRLDALPRLLHEDLVLRIAPGVGAKVEDQHLLVRIETRIKRQCIP